MRDCTWASYEGIQSTMGSFDDTSMKISAILASWVTYKSIQSVMDSLDNQWRTQGGGLEGL